MRSLSCPLMDSFMVSCAFFLSSCFFTFIQTSPIPVFTAPLPSFIHYSFLSWQAIRTARQPVHYAHMKPITPTGLANSSNIYLLPCEQRVNLPVTPKPSQPLRNKNITFPAPETALMLNLPSLTLKQGLKSDFNPHTGKDPKQLDLGSHPLLIILWDRAVVLVADQLANMYGLDHPWLFWDTVLTPLTWHGWHCGAEDMRESNIKEWSELCQEQTHWGLKKREQRRERPFKTGEQTRELLAIAKGNIKAGSIIQKEAFAEWDHCWNADSEYKGSVSVLEWVLCLRICYLQLALFANLVVSTLQVYLNSLYSYSLCLSLPGHVTCESWLTNGCSDWHFNQ